MLQRLGLKSTLPCHREWWQGDRTGRVVTLVTACRLSAVAPAADAALTRARRTGSRRAREHTRGALRGIPREPKVGSSRWIDHVAAAAGPLAGRVAGRVTGRVT